MDSCADNGYVMIGSLLCACVRSLSTDNAKLVAVELLSELSLLVKDEYRYVQHYIVSILASDICIYDAFTISKDL